MVELKVKRAGVRGNSGWWQARSWWWASGGRQWQRLERWWDSPLYYTQYGVSLLVLVFDFLVFFMRNFFERTLQLTCAEFPVFPGVKRRSPSSCSSMILDGGTGRGELVGSPLLPCRPQIQQPYSRRRAVVGSYSRDTNYYIRSISPAYRLVLILAVSAKLVV